MYTSLCTAVYLTSLQHLNHLTKTAHYLYPKEQAVISPTGLFTHTLPPHLELIVMYETKVLLTMQNVHKSFQQMLVTSCCN